MENIKRARYSNIGRKYFSAETINGPNIGHKKANMCAIAFQMQIHGRHLASLEV